MLKWPCVSVSGSYDLTNTSILTEVWGHVREIKLLGECRLVHDSVRGETCGTHQSMSANTQTSAVPHRADCSAAMGPSIQRFSAPSRAQRGLPCPGVTNAEWQARPWSKLLLEALLSQIGGGREETISEETGAVCPIWSRAKDHGSDSMAGLY